MLAASDWTEFRCRKAIERCCEQLSKGLQTTVRTLPLRDLSTLTENPQGPFILYTLHTYPVFKRIVANILECRATR